MRWAATPLSRAARIRAAFSPRRVRCVSRKSRPRCGGDPTARKGHAPSLSGPGSQEARLTHRNHGSPSASRRRDAAAADRSVCLMVDPIGHHFSRGTSSNPSSGSLTRKERDTGAARPRRVRRSGRQWCSRAWPATTPSASPLTKTPRFTVKAPESERWPSWKWTISAMAPSAEQRRRVRPLPTTKPCSASAGATIRCIALSSASDREFVKRSVLGVRAVHAFD